MNHVLSVRDLTKIYGKGKASPAVAGISFHLSEGEILGLLGPNGSGKTTTIQMLLDTLTPTSGTIEYFGHNFQKYRSEILSRVSFASTYSQLPPRLTIRENLVIIGHLYGLSKQQTLERCRPLLQQLGMADMLNKSAGALSAGQITRLMLVKSLFTNPSILLLDEPTASLDPDIAKEICDLLLDRREKTGISILFTSHKMQEVAQLCDRVIFMKKGEIIANDAPDALVRKAGKYALRLTIPERVDEVASFAKSKNFPFTVNEHRIEITLEEEEIPPLLYYITQKDIHYASVNIREPSLEDYFLHIARH